MSDDLPTAPADQPEPHEASLAEIALRRTAARTQWQKALARTKERFTPANLANEMIDGAAEAVGNAADKTATLAWAHRGKIALAGLLGGLIFWRKPIARAARPMASKAHASLHEAASTLKARTSNMRKKR